MFYKSLRVYPTLSHVRSLPHCIIIQIDRGNRRFFAGFSSLDNFEAWYKQLDSISRTLNEVITSDMRKLVLDIDNCLETDHCLSGASESLGRAECMWMYDFERHIKSRIRHVFSELEIGHPEILVYDICDDTTISYHVVVSNMAFSASTCLGLCLLISTGQVWEHMVDKGVYKSTQNIRIEGSTKYGQIRWKRLCGREESTPSPSLRKGLLSVISDIQHPDLKLAVTGDTQLYTMVKQHTYRDFKIRKICNNVVFLDRIRSGMCVQCHRVHTRENATVRYGIGPPLFMCWRQGTK
jgi:hypothetical protein